MLVAHILGETNRISQSDMNERVIRALIREALGYRRSFFGQIGDVRVSMGEHGRYRFYVFARDKIALGAAMLVQARLAGKEGHYVTEIGLLDDLRYQGIGYSFYKHLIEQGTVLFSGGSQTPDGAKVWRKLLADPAVAVSAVRLKQDDHDEISDEPADVGGAWTDPEVRLVATKSN